MFENWFRSIMDSFLLICMFIVIAPSTFTSLFLSLCRPKKEKLKQKNK